MSVIQHRPTTLQQIISCYFQHIHMCNFLLWFLIFFTGILFTQYRGSEFTSFEPVMFPFNPSFRQQFFSRFPHFFIPITTSSAFFSSGVRKERRASSFLTDNRTKSLTSCPLFLATSVNRWASETENRTETILFVSFIVFHCITKNLSAFHRSLKSPEGKNLSELKINSKTRDDQ